jgi:hypothetical protein
MMLLLYCALFTSAGVATLLGVGWLIHGRRG